MSHRRRVLNLVMSNELTSVYSLHRVNLLLPRNNLFYPTSKAADDAAAAKDPAVLFPNYDDDTAVVLPNYKEGPTGEESLEKVEKMQVPPPRVSFQPTPDPRYEYRLYSRLDCAALSESRTVFVDHNSRGAFLYDADRRRVVTMPSVLERKELPWGRAYFPVAGAAEGDDSVYVIDREPTGRPDDEDWFKFQAMVCRNRRWQLEELPRPPYVDDTAYRYTKEIVSYALLGGGGAASDVLCVATEGRGTYCFDTASRAWKKAAGGEALTFAGKVEHDRELGLWLGFLKRHGNDDHPRLCATSDLFADVDKFLLMCCARDDCRDLEAPWGWHRVEAPTPQVVALGSGRFCVTQFFETMRRSCSRCGHEEADKRFAVFTGVEVIRRDRKERDKQAGEGPALIVPPTELRVVIHKSKRHILSEGSSIEFVVL